MMHKQVWIEGGLARKMTTKLFWKEGSVHLEMKEGSKQTMVQCLLKKKWYKCRWGLNRGCDCRSCKGKLNQCVQSVEGLADHKRGDIKDKVRRAAGFVGCIYLVVYKLELHLCGTVSISIFVFIYFFTDVRHICAF